MRDVWDVIVVGSGNAGLCAALAAQDEGVNVLIIEKSTREHASGNTAHSAGAMRFPYGSGADIRRLLADPDDPRLPRTDFGSYTREQFGADLVSYNGGIPLSDEQRILVQDAPGTLDWLSGKGVKFEPIYSRQSFEKEGRFVFWGGLTLAAEGEGHGLARAERSAFEARGGLIAYDCAAEDLIAEGGCVVGVRTRSGAGARRDLRAGAVVLASGGFGSNKPLLSKHLGRSMDRAVVRGTPHNTGDGLDMAFRLGAKPHGVYDGCHVVPMGLRRPGGERDAAERGPRLLSRKICYFLGVMLNLDGKRFVDEGKDFRNYTYAQFGRSILEQPEGVAFQIFDAKVDRLLYDEYRTAEAYHVEADTIDGLIDGLCGIDKAAARATIGDFNAAVDDGVAFDPTVKDGRSAPGLCPPRSNWAQKLDAAPFKAFPVTGGITFTYGGLKVDPSGAVVGEGGRAIAGLFACGEIVGGVFFNGYPGGSGLTSGAVFGRRAGSGAAVLANGHAGAEGRPPHGRR